MIPEGHPLRRKMDGAWGRPPRTDRWSRARAAGYRVLLYAGTLGLVFLAGYFVGRGL